MSDELRALGVQRSLELVQAQLHGACPALLGNKTGAAVVNFIHWERPLSEAMHAKA